MSKLSIRRKSYVLVVFVLVLVLLVPAFGARETYAASSYWNNVNVSAQTKTSAKLTWKKLSKKQQKKISGVAVFRNGKLVKKLKKNAQSYTDKGLKAGKKYTYQLKTYKKTTKKVKMYYNGKTKKWQKKKISGAKTKKVKKTAYKYQNASPKKVLKTRAKQGKSDTSDTSGLSEEDGLDDIRKEMLDLVNEERAKVGAAPLTLQDAINECAQEKAIDLYTSGKFDHHSDTLGYFYDQFEKHGISVNGGGENIAMGQASVQAAMESWINSSGHYANIVNPNYTHAGFGYYKGRWVQQFADSPRVQGTVFSEATLTCPRCGVTRKESEFSNFMKYTTTGPDGSIIKVYQCNCLELMYLCPKCNTMLEEAGLSENGSVSSRCSNCGYSDTKECHVHCEYCNAKLLNNTIGDDFTLHFQGDLSEDSKDFNEIQVRINYCKACGKYTFIDQYSKILYTEMYEKYQGKIEEGEDLFDHIKWYYMVDGETEQLGDHLWKQNRYREEIPTPQISSLEQLLGSERLYSPE